MTSEAEVITREDDCGKIIQLQAGCAGRAVGRGTTLRISPVRPARNRRMLSITIGITAVAGGLFAMSQSFQPYIGFDFVIVMYAGVVLGGMGSILGAFWGGLTIGLVQQMSTLVLPYQLQNTAIFVVFLIIVFFRPQGMFGRVWERT